MIDSRRRAPAALPSLPDHNQDRPFPSRVTEPSLAARIGLFDAIMIVMGGIVGSGIFINPYVVATLLHTRALILAAWAAGGAIALLGAFVYAELAARMPKVGGQYAYLREAIHPLVGFLFGWAYLLVIGAGGTAAVAVTCSKYLRHLVQLQIPENVWSVGVVATLVVLNCLGVQVGSRVQSFFMLLRILAIALLAAGGAWLWMHPSSAPSATAPPVPEQYSSLALLSIFGAALIPVIFAYGGWESANFIAAEIRDPRKNLPRALVLGILGVLGLYLSINLIYVQILSPSGLAATDTPASAVAGRVFGPWGAQLIAAAIVISTVGFLSQAMLAYPRLYFAMAGDAGLPSLFARVSARSRVPVAAIILQGCVTLTVVLLGTYEDILSYVIVLDSLFFCLTAVCLFVFRARDRRNSDAGAMLATGFRVPGHPWTSGIFILATGFIVLNTIYKYPRNAGIALCILFAGVPFYFLMRGRARRPSAPNPRPS